MIDQSRVEIRWGVVIGLSPRGAWQVGCGLCASCHASGDITRVVFLRRLRRWWSRWINFLMKNHIRVGSVKGKTWMKEQCCWIDLQNEENQPVEASKTGVVLYRPKGSALNCITRWCRKGIVSKVLVLLLQPFHSKLNSSSLNAIRFLCSLWVDFKCVRRRWRKRSKDRPKNKRSWWGDPLFSLAFNLFINIDLLLSLDLGIENGLFTKLSFIYVRLERRFYCQPNKTNERVKNGTQKTQFHSFNLYWSELWHG